MAGSTFPVIHGFEHPLIGWLLYEDPVAAHTVRGRVSESPLHRHAGLISESHNKSAGWETLRRLLSETSPSSLRHCFPVYNPVVKWECSDHWFSSYCLFPPFLCMSLTFYAAICFSSFLCQQSLQNAWPQATMSAAIQQTAMVGRGGEGSSSLPGPRPVT